MGMFLAGLALLAAGYFVYGVLLTRPVRPEPERPTPALTMADGVDYVAMPTWRVYLVQLLNIAGLGPVFGPVMGALWGPQVFLWVVFGSILGGAVHDYLSGIMSVRNGGAGLPDLIGRYLGRFPRHFATFFILVLMVLVGTVFVKGPAELIARICPAEALGAILGDRAAGWLGTSVSGQSHWLWVIMALIFAYYVVATLLPVDKVIGRVYPLFAAALLVMVVGLTVAILSGEIQSLPFTLANLHPKQVPAWPIIFITVSCGAISGFHATQCPMMARCLRTERHMYRVFYGAMIAEGFIALVWATAAPGYYGGVAGLAEALAEGNAATVVHEICTGTMGQFGGLLAILGVVVLPITSGDTAFRVARLIAADYLHLPQKQIRNRYLIALPLFAVSIALNFIPFQIIWRYFGWANQTLSAVTLWAAAVFLARRSRRAWWLLAALPATFMTIMTTTYLLVESRQNGCLGLPPARGTLIGLALGAATFLVFAVLRPRQPPETDPAPPPGGEAPAR